MNRKSVFMMTGMLAVMSVLGGCQENAESDTQQSSQGNKNGEDVVEITYTSRGNADEIKVYQQAVDAFNESQDKIHVTFEASPSDGYNQQLITQLAGGTAADVIFVEDTIISRLVNNGSIADLTEFLNSEKSYVKPEDFDDSVWGASKKDNKIYGLSVDCNPVLLYYSPQMLKDLGCDDPQELFQKGEWNWENFDKICEKLKENGKSGMIQGGDNIRLYNWVFANGGSVWDGDTYKFDEKAREAFRYICEGITDGRFVYGGTLPDGQGEDAMFMSSQTGFIAAGRWLTKTFYEEGIDFDYIPYPSSDGTQYTPAQVACGYLCVNAKSEHLEEAMEFVSFYCGEKGQEVRIEGVGTSVPSVKVLDDLIKESKVPEHVEHILQVRATGWTSGDEEVQDVMYAGFADDTKAIFEKAYINGEDPDAVIDEAEKEAAEIIAEAE